MEWYTDAEYLYAENTIKNMLELNDVAERGVLLIDKYDEILTTYEKQKQYSAISWISH